MSQTHRLTDQVKILHKVGIVSNKQVLLLKRNAQAHYRPEKWDLPGGNAEWPLESSQVLLEHLHRADAVREVQEETGITIDEEQVIDPIFFDTFLETEKQVYTIVVGWLIKLANQPQVILSSEHTEFAWVSLSKLKEYDFGFAGGSDGFLVQIIKQAFARIAIE
ncbi:NUDIX domain-containing protein [Candidatus Woesebacteria bacterium]|nr:NUDIX domain-containing protein [Candidatus Woesebacteria bacterium]